MMMEVTIIGGGLAGLAMADALLHEGLEADQIAVVDLGQPRHCTSRNLGAIVHPLVGRGMRLEPQTREVWRACRAQLERWQAMHPQALHRLEMMRPIDASKPRQTMLRNYLAQRDTYPPSIAHRLVEAEALEDHPHLGHLERAIAYRPGYAVDMVPLLEASMDRLAARGLRWIEAHVEGLRRGDRGELAVVSSAGTWPSAWVVLAMGTGLLTWFPDIELRQNWGELLRLEPPPQAPPLEVMISARGYLAPMPDGRTWVLGSTYLRAQDLDGRSERDALDDLLAKGRALSPWVDEARAVAFWRGSRAVHPGDRYPVAGIVPEHPRLAILGGLGSKGLLWSPWLARGLARLICTGNSPLWGVADTGRLRVSGWTPNGCWIK